MLSLISLFTPNEGFVVNDQATYEQLGVKSMLKLKSISIKIKQQKTIHYIVVNYFFMKSKQATHAPIMRRIVAKRINCLSAVECRRLTKRFFTKRQVSTKQYPSRSDRYICIL